MICKNNKYNETLRCLRRILKGKTSIGSRTVISYLMIGFIGLVGENVYGETVDYSGDGRESSERYYNLLLGEGDVKISNRNYNIMFGEDETNNIFLMNESGSETIGNRAQLNLKKIENLVGNDVGREMSEEENTGTKSVALMAVSPVVDPIEFCKGRGASIGSMKTRFCVVDDIAKLGGAEIFDVNGATITNVGTPVNDSDATTKKYVDDGRTRVVSGSPEIVVTENEKVVDGTKAKEYTVAFDSSSIKKDIEKGNIESRAGIAGVAAMANLPQINDSGSNKYNISVAGAGYKGENGLALGLSGVTDDGRFVYKASVAADSRSNVVYGVGAGFQFGKRDIEPNELDRLNSQMGLLEFESDRKIKKLENLLSQMNQKYTSLDNENNQRKLEIHYLNYKIDQTALEIEKKTISLDKLRQIENRQANMKIEQKIEEISKKIENIDKIRELEIKKVNEKIEQKLNNIEKLSKLENKNKNKK